ncbi:MAG: tetratricopeptide repeat protein [Rhodothermales bacterium]
MLSAFLMLATGCKEGSFIGRRYENFTAYYNTFYNARKTYAEGVKSVERTANQGIDRTIYLSIFYKPERVANQQEFNDAIKKSADVLRENPGSKWVDDALLLIGKSYFYLENYVGAEEKFQEVISIGGPLEDEARFWLARTLIASNSFDEAMNHLEFSLSMEGMSRKWASLLRLALGELHVRQNAWEEASLELERGLERVSDGTTASRASFLLGQVYESLQRYDKAMEAYRRVQRYKPEYALSYAAMVSEIRVEAQHGNPELALRQVRSMERDDKNFDNRAELVYLRGRVYQAMRLGDQAYTVFEGLLYSDDRTLNANAIKGKIHYAMGELYRDVYVDYNYAAAHFDTARASLQSGNRRQAPGAAAIQYAPEAITDGEKQAEVFGSFYTVHNKLVNLDSLMRLGELDEETFEAFILDLRKKKAEEILEEQRLQARRQAEQQFQQISNVADRSGKQLDQFAAAASSSSSQGDADSGFLFYKDRIRLQEGRLNFIAKWGDRPRVPNWRRLDAVNSAAHSAQSATADSVVISARQQLLDDMELPPVDYSAVPRDEESRAAMEEQRAQVRYELANVLFLSMERPDSAATWYRMVIEDTGDLPVAQRAYYALAEVQRALGDTLAAQGLYARVLDLFPSNDFAGRVREQLGMAPIEVIEVPDSTALADAAYDRAYDMWNARQYGRAIEEMILAAEAYPSSDIAPRAMLAIGAMYMEWADADSLDIYALPVPDLPDSLLAHLAFVDTLKTTLPPVPPTTPAQATPAAENGAAGVTPQKEGAPADTLASAQRRVIPPRTARPATPASDTSASGQSALPDSAAVAAALPADSTTTAAVDSVRVDTVRVDKVRADTMRADTVPAMTPDTLATPVAPGRARVLTHAEKMAAVRPVWAPIRIDRIYAAIVERYPRTPYADVANRRLSAIAELRPEQEVQEMIEQIQQQAEFDAMTPEERMFKGPEPIDQAAEGWVFVVASFADQERAAGVMKEYQEKGYRSGVMKAPTRYRVILGHFPTLDEARNVLAAHKDEFPPNTWFLDLQKPR